MRSLVTSNKYKLAPFNLAHRDVYTLCSKKTCDHVFDDKLN